MVFYFSKSFLGKFQLPKLGLGGLRKYIKKKKNFIYLNPTTILKMRNIIFQPHIKKPLKHVLYSREGERFNLPY